MLDRGTFDPDGEAAKRRALAKIVATEGDHWIWQGAGSKSYVTRRHRGPEKPIGRAVQLPRPVMMLRDGTSVSPAVVLSCSSLDEMVKWKPGTTCDDRQCVNPDHFTFEPRITPPASRKAAEVSKQPVYANHAEYGTVEVLARAKGMAWIFDARTGQQDVVAEDEISDVRDAA